MKRSHEPISCGEEASWWKLVAIIMFIVLITILLKYNSKHELSVTSIPYNDTIIIRDTVKIETHDTIIKWYSKPVETTTNNDTVYD